MTTAISLPVDARFGIYAFFCVGIGSPQFRNNNLLIHNKSFPTTIKVLPRVVLFDQTLTTTFESVRAIWWTVDTRFEIYAFFCIRIRVVGVSEHDYAIVISHSELL